MILLSIEVIKQDKSSQSCSGIAGILRSDEYHAGVVEEEKTTNKPDLLDLSVQVHLATEHD